MFVLCEARPDLSGALFLQLEKRGQKKRERRADKGAQIDQVVNELEGLRI